MYDYIEIIKLGVFILFALTFLGSFSLAPFVPTRKNDIKKLLQIIDLQAGEKFLEIGCGTARVTVAFAKKYPQNFFTGIELGLGLFLISFFKVKFLKLTNTKIIYANALKYDFSEYDVLYIFGMPNTMTKKLLPKLEKELRSGARFYSYCMKMGENDSFFEKRIKNSHQELAVFEYIKK